jgi:hypothetical protein
MFNPNRNTPGIFRSELPRTTGSQRTLTFAERVAYQRAIEDVYWQHRIWPKERPDPKPSLDAAMSQTELEKKVDDYLRDSQELENQWQGPDAQPNCFVIVQCAQIPIDRS